MEIYLTKSSWKNWEWDQSPSAKNSKISFRTTSWGSSKYFSKNSPRKAFLGFLRKSSIHSFKIPFENLFRISSSDFLEMLPFIHGFLYKTFHRLLKVFFKNSIRDSLMNFLGDFIRNSLWDTIKHLSMDFIKNSSKGCFQNCSLDFCRRLHSEIPLIISPEIYPALKDCRFLLVLFKLRKGLLQNFCSRNSFWNSLNISPGFSSQISTGITWKILSKLLS